MNPDLFRRPDGSFDMDAFLSARKVSMGRDRGGPRHKYAAPYGSPRGTVFAPGGGLKVDGQFFMGGEALPAESVSRVEQTRGSRRPPLHTDLAQAQADFHRNPGPTKKEYEDPAWRSRTTFGTHTYDVDGYAGYTGEPAEAGQMPFTPAQGRARIGDLGRYVTDQEASTLSPANAQALLDIFNEAVPSGQLAAGALVGKRMKGWYRDTAEALVGMFGQDAPRFAALLSATSPQKSVTENLINALWIWDAYSRRRNALGREMTGREARDWVDGQLKSALGDNAFFMPGEAGNIVRALTKPGAGTPGHLSGPKVGSFAPNTLFRHLEEVTNDTWAAVAGGVRQGDLKGVSVGETSRPDGAPLGYPDRRTVAGGPYAGLSAKTRLAGQRLFHDTDEPWNPLEVQETTWSAVRSLSHALGGHRYRDRDVPSHDFWGQDPVQALRGLRHEDVGGNTAFASILAEDGDAHRAVESLGLSAALERVLAAQEARRRDDPPPSGPVLEGMTPEQVQHAENFARQAAMGARRWMMPNAKYARPGPAAGRTKRARRREKYGSTRLGRDLLAVMEALIRLEAKRGRPKKYMARPAFVPESFDLGRRDAGSHQSAASYARDEARHLLRSRKAPAHVRRAARAYLADPNDVDLLLDLADAVDQEALKDPTNVRPEYHYLLDAANTALTLSIPHAERAQAQRGVRDTSHEPEGVFSYGDLPPHPGVSPEWVSPDRGGGTGFNSLRAARIARQKMAAGGLRRDAGPLAQAAFEDRAEDPMAFDLLGDMHEEAGDEANARRVRSLRPSPPPRLSAATR